MHERRRGRVAESSVLRQGGDGAEGLTALVTFDLHSAVGVHSLVTTEIRKLCVTFKANFASEGFD